MKVHFIAKLRSLLIGVFALLVGAFVALTTFAWFPVAGQNNIKSIEGRKTLRPDVVPIEEIKAKKSPFALEKSLKQAVTG